MDQYNIRLSKVTGAFIFNLGSSKIYTGTKDELAHTYRQIQVHNLIFGWWGIIAFFLNILAIVKNARAKRKLDNAL